MDKCVCVCVCALAHMHNDIHIISNWNEKPLTSAVNRDVQLMPWMRKKEREITLGLHL